MEHAPIRLGRRQYALLGSDHRRDARCYHWVTADAVVRDEDSVL